MGKIRTSVLSLLVFLTAVCLAGRMEREIKMEDLPPHVTTPPKLEDEPSQELAYKEGEPLKLPCKASGTSPITYSWKRNLALLDIDGVSIQQEAGSGTLIIKPPSTEEEESIEGEYQCFASNQFGRAVSVKSMVKKAYIKSFDTVVEPKILRPKVGDYLNLTCHPPESYPTAVLFWNKGTGSSSATVTTSKRIALDYNGNLHIANVEVGDEELYQCKAKNEMLRITSEGDDTQVEPKRIGTPTSKSPKLVWSSPENIVKVKGEIVRMMCIFSGYPTPDVRWERVDGRPLGPRTDLSSADGLEIKILRVDMEHAGRYRCTASSAGSNAQISREFTLTVQYQPRWINGQEPTDVTASEEENAQVKCPAQGVPEPVWEFTFNGNPQEGGDTPKDDRMTIRGDTVFFTNLTKTDTQVIQCNVSNTHGYLYTNVFLNVLAEPPYFVESPPAVTKVAAGQEVILTCRVFGAPKPKITWKRGEPPQEVRGPRFDVLDEGDLKIKPAVNDDDNTYWCHASNKFGQAERSGTLIVRERTSIDYHPRSIVVEAGTDVSFFCNATTDELEERNLKIEWLREDEAIDYTSEGKISKDVRDDTLFITNAAPEDSGRYTCVASNGIDEDQVTAQLTVKDRPDPPYQIRCHGCTSSRAEVSWSAGSANNEEIIEFIVKYNTSFDEPNTYHVGAKVGKDQSSARIELSPYANYTFHVLARNSLGVSDMSPLSVTKCETPSKKPTHDPDWVCTSSEEATDLVIRWMTFPPIMHNGSDFHYVIRYRLAADPLNTEQSEEVTDWDTGKLVVTRQPVYTEYEISVKTANEKGIARGGDKWKTGYSGEDTPNVSPANFELDEDTLNATHAMFSWEPVDTSVEAINGFFVGYRIAYWRAEDPDEKRTTEFIENQIEQCPPDDSNSNRISRLRRASTENGMVADLWPYSDISAAIQVMNGGKSGALSDPPLSFRTPEGVPSAVMSFEISEIGSHHLRVEWMPPISPNGIVLGYYIAFQEIGTGGLQYLDETVSPLATYKKIHDLDEMTLYEVYIWAFTSKGKGEMMRDEAKTKAAAAPDVPIIGTTDVGDTWVNVTFIPTDKDQNENPGTYFYIEYKKPGEDEWSRTEVEKEHNWINVTDLEPGSTMIRVVAVNGNGQETRSDTAVVEIGREPEDLVTEGNPVTAAATTAGLNSGWFIAIIIALILLLLVLLIICLIRRNRGGKYPVHEKEKLAGRDPEKEDEEAAFGEYTKADLPEKKKSRTSLNSEERPLESDTDSMAEYYETDPSKFNEDGSFIGQYGGKKKAEPETTSPSALSTFV